MKTRKHTIETLRNLVINSLCLKKSATVNSEIKCPGTDHESWKLTIRLPGRSLAIYYYKSGDALSFHYRTEEFGMEPGDAWEYIEYAEKLLLKQF